MTSTANQRKNEQTHRQTYTDKHNRAFVNTCLLVQKHVKISVDEWILETTCPQKHVKFLEQYIP